MKTGAFIVSILIGILVIGVLIYIVYSSISISETGDNLNNGESNGEINDNSNVNLGQNNENTESQQKTYNIDIQNFAFKTKTLTIKKGDTVVWTNLDSIGHTVTSDSGNELDSELFADGEKYTHTFTQSGTFNYYCKPHPSMRGTIIVE